MKAYFEIDLNGKQIVNELERSSMEISSYSDNIAFLLNSSTTADIVESSVLKSYQKKQIDAKLHYEKQKRKMEKEYIPDYLYNKFPYDWKLDFGTDIVTVTVYDEKSIQLLQEHGENVTIIS